MILSLFCYGESLVDRNKLFQILFCNKQSEQYPIDQPHCLNPVGTLGGWW
jgi:hypothetical protein